jgi:hypothetical protein
MTRHEGHAAAGRDQPGPENRPRLRLKPKAPVSGHVDGAWWPRTADLTPELPDLLAALSVRLGAIDRVLYNLAEWAQMPKRLTTGGRAIRLDGYRLQPADTLQVFGLGREKILVTVVPPHTDPDDAHEAMTAAAPNDATMVGQLLAIGAHDGEAPDDYHRPTFRQRVRRFRP